jgi:hypothetical protein
LLDWYAGEHVGPTRHQGPTYNVGGDGRQQAVEQLGAALVRLEELAPELAGLARVRVGALALRVGHDGSGVI